MTQSPLARTTRQPASVHPYFETEIHCKVGGFVVEVAADIGDVVKQGQTLAVIDAPEMQRQQATVEARIALRIAQEKGAAAEVDLAAASVQSMEAKLDQAKSELGSFEAALAAAEAEFSRTKDLVERGSLQSRLLDEARKQRDSESAARQAALSAVESMKAQVSVAEAQRATSEAKLRTAEAETQVARNQLDELKVMIGYLVIKAPYEGVVSQRHVELGELVDDGVSRAPLFVLSQLDKVRVRVPVPEVDAAWVQPGDTMTLSFPSFADEPPIVATVTRRSGSLDPASRTMSVEAEIENSSGKLLPGMFGEATIDLETQVAAKTLPARAVRFDEDGRAYVYVLAEDNVVSVTDVAIGLDDGNVIEIVEGIRLGQKVIDSHRQRFTEGQVVKPL